MYLEQKLIGTRIFEELLKKGYTGSITSIYRHLKTLKQQTPGKTTVRFETEPGVQGQFDRSPYEVIIAGEKRKVIAFYLS